MKVIVQENPFDPCVEIKKYEDTLDMNKVGGIVNFIGNMRDVNDGHDVNTMYLDYYPGMTEKQIEKVMQEAMDRWDIMDVLVVHRHGEMKPKDPIVLVAVWSAHRAEAFDACRYVINYLKKAAPFWKRETTKKGEDRWVEHNTKDPNVAKREEAKRSA